MSSLNTTEITRRVTIRVFATAEYKPAATMCDRVARAASEQGDMDIHIIDPWEQPELVVADRVIANPTVVVVVDGQEQAHLTGVKSAKRVRRTLEAVRAPRLAVREAAEYFPAHQLALA